ncbi:glycoside hydrolase family 2 TIM barrel-domain containing protein [Paucihalobacter sp.]|uniref:glycoside hydrolase family 2 TIM barrel-domain containing protein n=1 Tax=Paucihalobacter sp. TaxID=2850405 RepID=UPI002FE02BE7
MKLFVKVIVSILFICLVGFFALISYNYTQRPDYKSSEKTVHIVKYNNKFTLIRNGQPFEIKGAAGDSNIKMISEIGGNTLRVYDTVNIKNILNEAHDSNLAVILDIPLPRYDKDYFNYEDENYQKNLKKSIQDLVNRHKNHPALLMWNLGNEVDFPFSILGNGFTNTYNDLVNLIHESDPNHPISTTITGRRSNIFSLFFFSPKLDIYGFNTFGALYELDDRFSTLGPINGKFPFYLSEWGSNGPWENGTTSWGVPIEPFSSEKAKQIEQNYKLVEGYNKTNCVGSLIFYWGNKQESTHTWFSLFDENDLKSHQIETLLNLWNVSTTNPKRFHINHIKINNQAIVDSLILNRGDTAKAQINLSYHGDSLKRHDLTYKWELYPEAWQYQFSDNQVKPKKVAGYIVEDLKDQIIFKTPKKEGPYRLFVTIYDTDNYFATANLPFYILEKL